MNRKQERFVAEYLIDFNATQAAVRAGYAKSRAKQTGYRLLQNPEVEKAVAKESAARQERLGIDADLVVTRAWLVHEKAYRGAPKVTAAGEPIYVDGQQLREWSPPTALRALEVLMKHLGIAGSEKLEAEITGAGGGPVEFYTLDLGRELPELEDAE